MTTLILGTNGSGKSAYAEQLIMQLSKDKRYYIATMIPYGEEGQARIEKHRIQRKYMGFITVEKPFYISEICLNRNAAVLLEDVSNLLSNVLFGDNCNGNEHDVFFDITAMCVKCCVCVIVSIDGLTAKPEYDKETRNYIDSLNRLNNRLCNFADVVISMRDGLPVFLKGSNYVLD